MSDTQQLGGLPRPNTDDILAVGLIAFQIGASSYFVMSGQGLPGWLQFADLISILTATVWAFGRGAFKTAAGVTRTAIKQLSTTK